MQTDGFYFKGHLCFSRKWAGFDSLTHVNVLIGRNNSGKSCLLDVVDILTRSSDKKAVPKSLQLRLRRALKEEELESAFPKNTSGGELGGNHWAHGKLLVGCVATWEVQDGKVANLSLTGGTTKPTTQRTTEARCNAVSRAFGRRPLPFARDPFRRLLADRDLTPEPSSVPLSLEESGGGATNIIRRFLTSSSSKLPRELIQVDLLGALNSIFEPDATFTEIAVQAHDEAGGPADPHMWEVHLAEHSKGLVPMSNSGSGLKTVLLVLLNLLVIPKIDGKEASEYVFAFEELENNLHPSLLRRLLAYIEGFAVSNDCNVFLTTHSSTALDMFSTSPHAQIVHVEHNGEYATTRTLKTHFDGLNVVGDLGARASDLLQANGIVWVEGPSDRIYVNRWIELFSDGKLQEGRHYQCAFYGGALLSNYDYGARVSDEDRADILQINKNAVLIADGDRSAADGPGSRIKLRVSRIKKPIEALGNGHAWVTDAKEIENYIPAEVLGELWSKSDLPPIDRYEHFSRQPTESDRNRGYIHKHCGRKSFNKVGLARAVAPLMTCENLAGLFDLEEQVAKLCDRIRGWNEL
jgi:putative ATP-dependent endonuclease of the OLD family